MYECVQRQAWQDNGVFSGWWDVRRLLIFPLTFLYSMSSSIMVRFQVIFNLPLIYFYIV